VLDLSGLELLQELVPKRRRPRLRVEDLLHDLLDDLVLLLYETMLTLELGPEEQVLPHHLVNLLLEVHPILVNLLVVRVLQAIRQECLLIMVLLGLLVCEVCNAPELLGGLHLVASCRLRPRLLHWLGPSMHRGRLCSLEVVVRVPVGSKLHGRTDGLSAALREEGLLVGI